MKILKMTFLKIASFKRVQIFIIIIFTGEEILVLPEMSKSYRVRGRKDFPKDM